VEFLAATVLPLSSEAPLMVYVHSYQQFAGPALVATAGDYLGACTSSLGRLGRVTGSRMMLQTSSAIFLAPTYRRLTSSQLTFRMKASTYFAAADP